MALNRWWLDEPAERYWVETLSERRPTLGVQLHAPQADDSGRPNWRYDFVREVRPGDVVLHWLSTEGEHGFAGWSIVAGEAESRPIEWQARGTYGRARERGRPPREEPGWWAPLRDIRALAVPVGLAELNERRPGIEAVHEALAVKYGSPLYLALTLYQPPPGRGVQVGQGYLFKWPADLNFLFEGLRPLGELTQGEPADSSESDSDGVTQKIERRRRSRDSHLQRAVELHAMDVASAWYIDRGYAVEDVSRASSWDLTVVKGSEERRVEVKGSLRPREAVDLTANEVANALGWGATDLFVVDEIQWRRDGVDYVTAGGRCRRWAAWTPTADSLYAVAYSHLLPSDHEELAARPSERRTPPLT